MTLVLGGITYPLVAQAVGQPVTAVADPWLLKALDFWSTCINTYLESAYVAAMGGKAITAPSGRRACASTLTIDPVPWLGSQVLRPPLLACHPTQGMWSRFSMETDQDARTYRVSYVLPAMTFQVAQVASPILQAVAGLLPLVTEKQRDASYNANERVWETHLKRVVFGSYEFDPFVDPDAGTFMPCLFMDVVVEQIDAWTLTNPTTLVGTQLSVGIGDNGDDGGILNSAIVGNSEVA